MNRLFNPRGIKFLSYSAATLTVASGAFIALNHSNSKLFNHQNKPSDQVFFAEEPVLDQKLLDKVQPTVWTGNHPQCVVATIHLKHDAETLRRVLKTAAELEAIAKNIAGEDRKEDEDDEYSLPVVMASVGFDTRLWKQIASQYNLQEPKGTGPYEKRVGKFGSMPDAGTDLVLHVKADSRSQCYEVVQAFVNALPQEAIVKIEDRYGWQFRDGRDLSGFIDGTENPSTKEERVEAAVIPQTGGSFLIHQVWQHDLQGLKNIGQREQEGWIGRKKDWSEELSEKEMPLTSHVRRMRDESFKRIPIVRQSMPYGSVGGDSGLLFIAYSNNVNHFDRMLDRMVGKTEDGHSDYVMKFSKCLSSNYYYIPSKTELAKFKDL